MSLNLTKYERDKILERDEFKILIANQDLLKKFETTYIRTGKIFLEILENTDKNGLEKSPDGEYINPILWQCGHIIYFFIQHCKDYFQIPVFKDDLEMNIDFYDSFKNKSQFRSEINKLVTINILLDDFKLIYENITEQILRQKFSDHKYNYIKTYVLNLCILHTEMHIEALIFSGLNLGYQLKNFISFGLSNTSLRGVTTNIMLNIEFKKIEGGNFIQGSKRSVNYLSFDNERPAFHKKINSFYISKYPITETQYLDFILDGGYETKSFWTEEGWDWIKKNNITCPLYWKTKDYELRKSNFPICNISWYEAKAFCRWGGYRLPTESEWEYVATNGNRTKYPWGNKMNAGLVNLNYTINRPLEVNDDRLIFEKTLFGVQQLIGNVWEWCEEPIYPYDGFNIDPVYREMSYPFFGFKKICRGGCFAVPEYLIHSKYRNAQIPECRIQFIGFRVCKDYTDLKKVRKARRLRITNCIEM